MTQTAAKRVAYPGHSIAHTPSANVASGDVIEIGSIPMIAESAILANTAGNVSCEGIFDIPKNADVFAAGDAVYWDSANADLGLNTGTADNATGNLIGLCTENAAANATVVRTKLTAAKRTTTIGGSITADDITGSDSALAITAKSGAGTLAIAGGAGNANAVGGTVTIAGGAGGTGTSNGAAVGLAGGAAGAVGGIGGALNLISGAGDTSNGTAGAINIDSGAGATKGAITIATNAASLTVGKMPRFPAAIVAANGGNQATAGVIAEGITVVTDADNAKGVILPACVNGATCIVISQTTDKTLKLYPPTGKQINGAGANNAVTLAANGAAILVSEGTNSWVGGLAAGIMS